MAQTQIIYGLHTVAAAVRNDPQRVIEVWVDHGRQDGRITELLEQVRKQGIALQEVNKKALNKLTEDARHQGVAAKYQAPKVLSDNDLIDSIESLPAPAFLVLDGIQDPQNLGACLRSADAAGIHGVVLAKDRSVAITPTVRKVASGAADALPVYVVTNLARTLRQMQQQGIWIYGFDDQAEQTYADVDLTSGVAIVVGAEGKGLRRLTREHVEVMVKIPMLGRVESLNLGVAASIAMFEIQRQRLLNIKKG